MNPRNNNFPIDLVLVGSSYMFSALYLCDCAASVIANIVQYTHTHDFF